MARAPRAQTTWPRVAINVSVVALTAFFSILLYSEWRSMSLSDAVGDHGREPDAYPTEAPAKYAEASSSVTAIPRKKDPPPLPDPKVEPPSKLEVSAGVSSDKTYEKPVVAQRKSGNLSKITILLIPSEVLGDKKLLRLQVIARTWGSEAKTLGIRIVALCAEPEVALYESKNAGLKGTVDFLAVPSKYVAKGDLLNGVYLGWLDHGPTLDQEMWALSALTANKVEASVLDWIIVANDAAFFLPSNLVCFLRQLDPKTSVYSGHMLWSDYKGGTPFASTGPGAVLSKKAAKAMWTSWARGRQNTGGTPASSECVSTNKWEATNPAVVLGACAKAIGAKAGDDRNGKENRFHAYGPVRLVSGRTDAWFQGFHKKFYGEPPQAGLGCCAPDTVSFHYVEDKEAEFLWDVLVARRDRFRAMGASQLEQAYPKQLGPYAHAPTPGDKMWELLLRKLLVLNADTCI